MLSQVQSASRQVQGLRIHQSSAALGKLSFAPLRKFLQQVLAGQQVQDGVSQELQLFVILRWLATLLVRRPQLRESRAMRQGAPQQFGILERVAQLVLERLTLIGHRENKCRAINWERLVA